MAVFFKRFPRFLRAVARPTDAPASQIARAETVYISGVPTQADFDALVERVEELETP